LRLRALPAFPSAKSEPKTLTRRPCHRRYQTTKGS
jgi:hypothetical protein